MSYPTTAPSTVVNIPVRGMNTRNSPLNMDPQTSLWLENVDTDGQRLSVRNGFDLHGSVASNEVILGMGVWGDPVDSSSKLCVYTQGNGNNKLQLGNGDGTFTAIYTAGASQADEAYPINYKSYLGFNVEINAQYDAVKYDGTTASAMGFTDGSNYLAARAACEYNGRVYLAKSSTIYYGGLTYVTGTCSNVSLSDFYRHSFFPAFMHTLSSPGDRASETYMAIGSTSGEILVYGGDNPNSSTWAMAGRYKVPPIMGMRAAIELNNDIWILTMGGIISLRALMSSGAEAFTDLSPTYSISLYWNALMAAMQAGGDTLSGYTNVSAAYWPEKNKLFIFVPASIGRTSPLAYDYVWTNQGTILVYDLASQAWTIHTIPTTMWTQSTGTSNVTHGCLTYFQNNIYFHIGRNVYKYGTNFMDDCDPTRSGPNAFHWTIEGAHSVFGDPNAQKTVNGWSVLMKADHCASSVQLATSIDMSRISRDASTLSLIDGINSVNCLNGGMGTEFNWTLSGTTNANITGPVELYSMGVIK